MVIGVILYTFYSSSCQRGCASICDTREGLARGGGLAGIEGEVGVADEEVRLFSPHKQRIATAVAATPVELMAITEDRVIAPYTENREFGFYLVSLITRRLIANNEELERRLAREPAAGGAFSSARPC